MFATICSVQCLRSPRIALYDQNCRLSVKLRKAISQPIARAPNPSKPTKSEARRARNLSFKIAQTQSQPALLATSAAISSPIDRAPKPSEPSKPTKSPKFQVARELPSKIAHAQAVLFRKSADSLSQCAKASQVLTVCDALVGTPKLDMTKADFTSGRGRKFGCLPDDLQSLLLSTVTRLKYTISAWDLANLLAKFGNLELDLTSAPPDFRDTIHYLLLRCVKHMNAWQLSRTLWGLAILNVSWDSLCSETQRDIDVTLRKLSGNMNHLQFAKCAHAIALMCFDAQIPTSAALHGAHATLINEVLQRNQPAPADGVEIGESDNFRTSLHGNSKVQIFAHYAVTVHQARNVDHRVPQDILQPAESTPPAQKCSGLEQRVVDELLAALQSLDVDTHYPFEFQREYSHFSGHLPVDVAILQHSKVVALVEIDGPFHHRRKDGSLRRKDQLKEAMYKQALPDALFHRVHYLEEENVAARGFIQVLSAAHSGPAWLCVLQRFVRRIRALLL